MATMKKSNVKYKAGDYLLVKWLDACSFDDWTDRHESDTPPPEIHTVGIFVMEEKTYLTVALNHDTVNDKLSCLLTVPKGMIKEIKILKE